MDRFAPVRRVDGYLPIEDTLPLGTVCSEDRPLRSSLGQVSDLTG